MSTTNEPFTEQEKTAIAGIVATKTPKRHKIVTTLFYTLWTILIIQMLGRGLLSLQNTLLYNLTVVLLFIAMYLRSISEREQIIRKLAQGTQLDQKLQTYYLDAYRKNRKRVLLIFLFFFASVAVFIAILAAASG